MMRRIVIVFVISIVLAITMVAYAAVPHLINYQGRLTGKDGKPLDGTNYTITFRIYDAENAGNLLWQGTYNVAISKGVFSVLLGERNDDGYNFSNLTFDKPYFLEIKVQDEVMSPRQRITSSGYAITAENVLSLPSGIIVMWSGSIVNIPNGWALCDGTNGTPNLKDRFIVGAGSTYAVAQTGGEAAHILTVAEIPAHTHSGRFAYMGDDSSGDDSQYYVNKGATSESGATGSGQPHNNLPPYYALAYIMKL